MKYSQFAKRFDAPLNSDAHNLLEETAWMGGPLTSIRYYLGRLIGKNLFQLHDDGVEEELVKFIAKRTSTKGAEFVRGLQGWQIADAIVRHHFEMNTRGESIHKRLHVAALEAQLTNPELSMSRLAKVVGTTEKQLARISTLTVLRRSIAQTKE